MSAFGRYLATQIKMGKLEYGVVIKKFPQYEEDIDEALKEYGILDKYKK